MQDAGYRMQDAGCRIQDAGCRIQDAGCRMQEISHFGSCILYPAFIAHDFFVLLYTLKNT